jgi:hypothetical protein
MLNVFDWFDSMWRTRPWLILGKGPSFAKLREFNLDNYAVLGLNHVCREQRVTLAHAIDLEVIDQLGEAIERNADFLVMPWVPHVKNDEKALVGLLRAPTMLSRRSLDQLVMEHSILRRLHQQGRLLWYNLVTAGAPRDASPVVRVQYFSAEAALHLLALAGVRQIRSLGVDGGASYAGSFDDLKEKTLLVNSLRSFDAQFAEFAKTISETGIDYSPADIESPVRVYVASTDAQMLSVKVLEWSIRKHASMTVEVHPMHMTGLTIPMSTNPANQPRTPFSFQRFLIPKLAEYCGKAIYLDSDMQVFKDIRDLWGLPFGDADLLAAAEPQSTGRNPQFSVMLLNCERLRWDIDDIVSKLDSGDLTYESLMYDMAIAGRIAPAIDPSWNSLERFEDGETALLHYTDMGTQPWVSTSNPLNYLWMRDLFEAIDSGSIATEYVREHVEKGYVRPSILYQIERRIDDSLLLPKSARDLDRDFQAPFTTVPRHSGSPWRRPTGALRAVVRYLYHGSFAARLERRMRNRLSR